MTVCIPKEWHAIAKKRPASGKEKITLRLEAELLKSFRSMGQDFEPRSDDVLRSYMLARLAGVIRRAETIAHFRRGEDGLDAPKPQFGEVGRELGAAREDAGPPVEQPLQVKMQETLQSRHASERAEGKALRQWAR